MSSARSPDICTTSGTVLGNLCWVHLVANFMHAWMSLYEINTHTHRHLHTLFARHHAAPTACYTDQSCDVVHLKPHKHLKSKQALCLQDCDAQVIERMCTACNVNHADSNKLTALDYCIRRERSTQADLLVKNGARMDPILLLNTKRQRC
jgi:hypothetical protein